MRQLLFIAVFGLLAALSTCHRPVTPRHLDGYETIGIDVSHHQGRIHWDSVAAAGVHFAFAKATEGETWQDSLFCAHQDGARRAGLRFGAYHFFRPAFSAERQAQNFLAFADPQPGDLPPVLDIETTDGAAPDSMLLKLRLWLFLIETAIGQKPIVYTNRDFYERWLAGRIDVSPLWIARYSDQKPVLSAQRPWLFWQYGNRGRLPGIRGDVDFNVFAGRVAALDSLSLARKPLAPVAPAPVAKPVAP